MLDDTIVGEYGTLQDMALDPLLSSERRVCFSVYMNLGFSCLLLVVTNRMWQKRYCDFEDQGLKALYCLLLL